MDLMASVNSPPQSTVVGNWAAPPDTIEPAPKKRVAAILAVILVGMIFGAFVLIEFLLPFEWDGEIWDDGGESMNWPDDPFQAAVYSFVAEYELGYGAAVGIYHDEYDDLTYEDVALQLEEDWEDNWGNSDYRGAADYAQAWVDLNAEEYGQQTFDLREVFKIAYGGLGWSDGNSGGGGGSTNCDQSQNSNDETGSNSSFFEIKENPNTEVSGMGCFTKYVEVFGLGVYAESGITDAQVLHAASVLGELLDNDEDGVADDAALLTRLQEVNAIIPMFNHFISPARLDFEQGYHGQGVSAVLFADEVDPTQPGYWGSDATIEEIMHTINHRGHVYIYPDAFGLEPDSSLLSDAMDEARGGQFVAHPPSYPEEAWYHYDDETCEYDCMAIEYVYWAQVSNMGILNDTATCDGIANEWEPCSRDLLESMDTLMFALITDAQYKLPQNAPDGIYSPSNE